MRTLRASSDAAASFVRFRLAVGLVHNRIHTLRASAQGLQAGMAPYASSYPATTSGPVHLVLSFGNADEETILMEWEEPVAAVDAVLELRKAGGDALIVDLPWEADGGGGGMQLSGGTLVVLDTNILLRYLPLLRSVVASVASASDRTAGVFELCIPHIVVQELDGLKTSTKMTARTLLPVDAEAGSTSDKASVGSLSRAASNWLLDCLPVPGSEGRPTFVRGQRQHESLMPRVNGRRESGSNDDEILDVARYWHESGRDAQVVLLSDDRNLCLKARVENVRTLSLDDSASPRSLLEALDPALASTVFATTRPTSPPLTAQHSSPTKLRPPQSLSNGRSRRSPRPTRASSLPLPAPLSPQPRPGPSPPEAHCSMEIDYSDSIILPDCSPPPAPMAREIYTPGDVVHNASDLLAFLTAHQLFSHVFKHLRTTVPDAHAEWAPELGDWGLWDGADVVQFARRWWVDGNVKEVCCRGCSKLSLDPPTAPAPAQINPMKPSRWSAQPTSSSPVLHPPLPAVTTEKSLAELYSTLPALAATLRAPHDDIARFSGPRFEIFLEHVHAFLCAIIGGLLNAGVRREVGELVAEWTKQLVKVGVALDSGRGR